MWSQLTFQWWQLRLCRRANSPPRAAGAVSSVPNIPNTWALDEGGLNKQPDSEVIGSALLSVLIELKQKWISDALKTCSFIRLITFNQMQMMRTWESLIRVKWEQRGETAGNIRAFCYPCRFALQASPSASFNLASPWAAATQAWSRSTRGS